MVSVLIAVLCLSALVNIYQAREIKTLKRLGRSLIVGRKEKQINKES